MLPYANDFAIAIQLFKKLRLPIFIQVVYNENSFENIKVKI